MKKALLLAAAGLAMVWTAAAAETAALKPVQLPAAQADKGRPLMQTLAARQSRRELAARRLPPQELANLLWAACGVNRPESGRRTAPTAVNWQEIDVYVAVPEGLYLYDAKAHALQPVLAEDVRPLAGRQEFVQTAPAVLIYVADFARMGGAADTDKVFYSAVDTGFVSQNVYLYCASADFATCVIGMVDKPALSAKLKLRPEQRVILTQPVGYPGGEAAAPARR
jgi:SagB-type dehydrogenase family enzyme